MMLNFLYTENNVGYLTETDLIFSKLYLSLRKKEGRVLTDSQVLSLPNISNKNQHYKEWKVRQKSTQRFLKYLKGQKGVSTILDIGNGNGWFTNKISEISNKNYVIGIDVNITELEQASRIFKKKNLQFVFGDIFKIESQFNQMFDIITINASVQYFPDFKLLINTLQSFLKPKGEIHVIDSPFYNNDEIINAKKRTFNYYSQIGFPEMATNYHHHSISDVKKFEILYQPKKSLLSKLIKKKDSPFCWLRFIKSFLFVSIYLFVV